MEPSSWPESNPRRRAIQQELIQGRTLASQLQTMLRSSNSFSPESPSTTSVVDDLAVQIMAIFNDTLSILNSAQISDFDHHQEIIPAAHDGDQVGSAVSSYWDHGTGKSHHDQDSISECIQTSVPPPKDRRGCYKRRRKTSQTWEKVTTDLFDDGHAWRKYGQKQILNAQHPRNYYRCTHKYEQGCKAKKQVQRIDQDDPPMYKTTYQGSHTCRDSSLIFKPPPADHHHIILDSSSTTTITSCPRDSSTLILSFESKAILGKNPDDSHYTAIKHDIFDHDDDRYCNPKEEAEELDNSQSCMYQYPDQDSPMAAPSSSGYNNLITTSAQKQMIVTTFDELLTRPPPTHANNMLSAEQESISGVLYSCTPSCTTPLGFGILDHMMVGSPNFDDIQFEF